MSVTELPKPVRRVPVDRSAVIAAYQANVITSEISARHGISGEWVRRIVKASGVPKRKKIFPPGMGWKKKQLPDDEIVSRRVSGATIVALCKEYAVSRPTIVSRLREAGIKPVRPRGCSREHLRKLTDSQLLEIWDNSADGASNELSKKYGVSAAMIMLVWKARRIAECVQSARAAKSEVPA